MRLQLDERKRRQNLKDHGLDFVEVRRVARRVDTDMLEWFNSQRGAQDWRGGLVTVRSLAYRRSEPKHHAIGLVDQRENGFITLTPVGAKSLTFRVTTVSPAVSAVAAIDRSAPSWPIRADSTPHRRAAPGETGRILSAYSRMRLSSHVANLRENSALTFQCFSIPRSIPPRVTTLRYGLSPRCLEIQRCTPASGLLFPHRRRLPCREETSEVNIAKDDSSAFRPGPLVLRHGQEMCDESGGSGTSTFPKSAIAFLRKNDHRLAASARHMLWFALQRRLDDLAELGFRVL